MKDTKELNRLGGKLVNAGFEIAEDGQINFADLPKIFDPLMAGQSGVDGIGNTSGELAKATNSDMDEATTAFAEELTSAEISEEDKYDISMIWAGIQSGRRMVARKTRRETLEALADKLPQIGPTVASKDGGSLTADDLEALLSD